MNNELRWLLVDGWDGSNGDSSKKTNNIEQMRNGHNEMIWVVGYQFKLFNTLRYYKPSRHRRTSRRLHPNFVVLHNLNKKKKKNPCGSKIS